MDKSNFEVYYDVVQFLQKEAQILDGQRLDEWLGLLADDIRYQLPVRLTRERGAEKREFSEKSYLYQENFETLQARVERLEKDYAWAENPPSRARRYVSNIIVEGTDGDEIDASSYVLLHRNQGDTTRTDLISAARNDTLRWTDGNLLLANREVKLGTTILDSKNLSLFL